MNLKFDVPVIKVDPAADWAWRVIGSISKLEGARPTCLMYDDLVAEPGIRAIPHLQTEKEWKKARLNDIIDNIKAKISQKEAILPDIGREYNRLVNELKR